MGDFGAYFGCSGDGGFTLARISDCSGVVGFTATTSLRPVRETVRPSRPDRGCEREIVRPSRPDRGCEREIVRPAHEKWTKIGVSWCAGRVFSRGERGRGRAGRILSRLPARYCHRPWLGHRPRPRYPPRNSLWPDTTPAPPPTAPRPSITCPPTAGPAAILCGASAPPTSASVGVLQH